jgi:hypothetical protein
MGITPSGRPLHTNARKEEWMDGLAPGLGWVRGKSWPITRTHVGLCLVWGTIGRCYRPMVGGIEMCVLDDANTWSLTKFVPDTNPLRGPHSSFVDGDCSGNLSLGQRIGDEVVLMGRRFWVGCHGMVFLVGTGGEEKASGHVQQGRFSLDDTRF